jgi:hypothetical protein
MEHPNMSVCRVHIGTLVVAAVVFAGAGCRKEPPAPTVLPDTPPPTAFFEWCKHNNFGLDLPESNQVAAGVKNLPTGAPVGDVEFEARTKFSTAAEAEAYLATIEKDLRTAAEERGVQLEAAAPRKQGEGFTIRYRSGRIRGTMTGATEIRDDKVGGEAVKRYFVRLNLTEIAVEP